MAGSGRLFIFISYSHSDAQFALRLSDRLNKAGIAHFIDKRSVPFGGHIPGEVHSALEQATHLLVLISPGSEKSAWVAYEIGYARGRGVTVVPYLRHPEMAIPGFIANIRYLRDLKEEAKFIADVKKGAAAKARKSGVPSSDRVDRPAAKPPPTDGVRSESSDTRAAAVIEMGKAGHHHFVPIIDELLKTETVQDVRRRAIEALGRIGGELTVTLLEEIWFTSELSPIDRKAAKDALHDLHAWSTDADEPLLNPANAEDLFLSLQTRVRSVDDKRDRLEAELVDEITGVQQARLFNAGIAPVTTRQGLKIDGFSLSWSVSRIPGQWYYRIDYSAEASDLRLGAKLIHWSATAADSNVLAVKYPVDIKGIAERARRNGFTVESLLEDHVTVNRLHWPGSRITEYDYPIEIASIPNGASIQMTRRRWGGGLAPWDMQTDWHGWVRLSLRLARALWSGS